MASDTTLERALKDAREGKLDTALASMRLLVQRKPKDYDAAQVIGLLLMQAGHLPQALHHLGRAVAGAPRVAGYRNNYANALMYGSPSSAVEQYRKALEIDPNYARAYLGLTMACGECGDSTAAIEAGYAGLRLQPGWVELTRNLCSQLSKCGRFEEAIKLFQQVLPDAPRDAGLRQSYVYGLNYLDIPVDAVARAHRDYAMCVPQIMAAARTDPNLDRPLHIGILSGDMRTHSVAYFAEPFMRHRPAGCKLTIFSTASPRTGDAMRDRLAGISDHWFEVSAMSDAAVGQLIRRQGIDVLLELGGHSSGGRLGALNDAPAPVIVTAIGYPNTTGHPAVGWRIVDSITDPVGAEAFCTERLARIDPCFLCYAPIEGAPEPALPAADGAITFGSFNVITKVGMRTLQLWAATLHAVENSRLLLKSLTIADPGTRQINLDRMAAAGIPPERVDIVAHAKSVQDHLATYSRVHVALDTVPYNGTTTTCEAMWMGVPVVTLLGDRHAARVSASLLTAVGHPEWIAQDAAQFTAIAAGLAVDRARLTALRSGLRGEFAKSVLCDQDQYARRFHGAIRDAWREWCATVR